MPHREIPGVSKRVAGRMWTLSCSPGAAGVSQTSVRPKLWVPTVTPSPQGILGGGRVTTQASQRALVVKNLPAMQETEEMRVGPLGHEDPLEEEMVAHSSILAWRIPWTEELVGYSPWGHSELYHSIYTRRPVGFLRHNRCYPTTDKSGA